MASAQGAILWALEFREGIGRPLCRGSAQRSDIGVGMDFQSWHSDYIEAHGGHQKRVASVASITRAQIDLRFLDWCVRLEMERGFINDEQRKGGLERYEAAKISHSK